MLVNFWRRVRVSGVKIHILTNFHYSSINIHGNKFFDPIDFGTTPMCAEVDQGLTTILYNNNIIRKKFNSIHYSGWLPRFLRKWHLKWNVFKIFFFFFLNPIKKFLRKNPLLFFFIYILPILGLSHRIIQVIWFLGVACTPTRL